MSRQAYRCDAPFLVESYNDKHCDGYVVGCVECGINPFVYLRENYDQAASIAAECEQVTQHKHCVYPVVTGTEATFVVLPNTPVMLVWLTLTPDRIVKLVLLEPEFNRLFKEPV